VKVLAVVSEIFPLVKTGGLADVSGALPLALAPLGVDVTTLLPGYPAITDALADAIVVRRSDDLFGGPARLLRGHASGLDLLLAAIPDLLARGAQLALLGSGDAALVDGFVAAAAANPRQVGCVIGYDETLAHLIQAGADAILVPSRFEPCGLTQLCALRYGALPVVARVGGLADSVIDANEMALASGVGTGLQFAPVTRDALVSAIQRAVELWQEPEAWRSVQRNAMRTDVSWRRPAAHYAALYREILTEHAA
jgi:glycogen synthase